jgi:hypothetical protein
LECLRPNSAIGFTANGKTGTAPSEYCCIDSQQAFYLQPSNKQGFNKEAGTVFALRLSISYFYIYLKA